MTKEEQWLKESIENYIFAYTGKCAKISDADAQHFTASVKSYLNLCIPSLPSDLDEAAEDMLDDAAYDWVMDNYGNPKESLFDFDCRCFKAGAEWMAGQGETLESLIWRDEDDKLFIEAFVDENKFKMADNVTIQIRKKQ